MYIIINTLNVPSYFHSFTNILSTDYFVFHRKSLNGSNTVNGNNTTPRDVYDKKRKLMETLDNFGVRKRIRQEVSV